MIASFAAIVALLINLTIARAAPVHWINVSALAEASLVEKPRRAAAYVRSHKLLAGSCVILDSPRAQ